MKAHFENETKITLIPETNDERILCKMFIENYQRTKYVEINHLVYPVSDFAIADISINVIDKPEEK